jgi:hypothetical protein
MAKRNLKLASIGAKFRYSVKLRELSDSVLKAIFDF